MHNAEPKAPEHPTPDPLLEDAKAWVRREIADTMVHGTPEWSWLKAHRNQIEQSLAEFLRSSFPRVGLPGASAVPKPVMLGADLPGLGEIGHLLPSLAAEMVPIVRSPRALRLLASVISTVATHIEDGNRADDEDEAAVLASRLGRTK